MKRSLIIIKAILIVVLVGLSNSCTNLDEELYGEVTPENFFSSEEEYVSALGAAYTAFRNFASGDPQHMHEVCTDEMVVPTRGQDWDDGGAWRRFHLHSWTYEDNVPNGAWNFGFGGVNTANQLIFQFESLLEGGQLEQETADAFIAELQAVRGFFYWQLIDLFGNVPLVLDFATAEATPSTTPRDQVYDAIVSDLETAVPKLSKTVDATTYGRMNYYAGQALLAKLYLNEGVYKGTGGQNGAWGKVITACDEIINSGEFSLESNYFNNFNVENSASSEFIFAIPYDEVFFGGFNIAVRTLHYGSQDSYNLKAQPWNGFCTLEEFYNSYDDADLRKGDVGTREGPAAKRGNFIAGVQWTTAGDKIIMDNGFKAADPNRTPEPFLGDPDEDTLNFGSMGTGQPQINELGPQALRQAGVRIGKWEVEVGGHPGNMNNDYAVFRYADILLMKAEALFWQGNTAEALTLVNQIRARAGVPDLTTLDGPVSFDLAGGTVTGGELFNEMGREMFAENRRRQDLIRWGFFTDVDKWVLPFYNPQDVLVTDEYTTLYPVHRDKLDANPNLEQNTGYGGGK